MLFIEDFLHYLKYEKRSSAHTIAAYTKDLQQFSDFIRQDGFLSVIEVNNKTVRRWMMSMSSLGNSPRTINRKVATLRSFYKYLMVKELVAVNPCKHIDAMKTPSRLPVFLSEESMDLMLDQMENQSDFIGVRDRIILETFYHTGMRLSELVGLTDLSVDFSNRTITVFGKRSKDRIIPMSILLESILKSYIQIRNETFGLRTGSNRLFLTSKGAPVYSKLIYRLVQAHISLVSTVTKKSPHVLRHTFATVLLNRGADLNDIKVLLGHSSLAATQIYTHSNIEKLKAIYQQAHPWAN